jgi:alpha-galactosidase
MTDNRVLTAFVAFLMLQACALAADKPLKVFILAGQSNMQGHARVSTIDALADDPKTAPLLKDMLGPDGKPKVCEKVWITSVGCLGDAYTDVEEKKGKLTVGFGAPNDKIGPEYTFGLTMERLLGEPVLIVKTAWGGRSLHTDFRPPSAGPYVWSEYELGQHRKRGNELEKIKAEKAQATGVYYREMIKHIRMVLKDVKRVAPDYDPKQGYELAGFVWFQGFNDLVSDWTYDKRMKPGGYDLYGELLAHLIRDVRKDLSAPKMPFVIGVMGIGGEREGKKPPQAHFRQAQVAPLALPEFKGNVMAVQTAPFWDDELDAIEEKRGKVSQMAYLLRVKDKNAANKDGKMTKEEQRAYLKKYEADLITPAEAAFWKRAASNGGYHYLGAAKNLAPIGKAFAEALVAPTNKP